MKNLGQSSGPRSQYAPNRARRLYRLVRRLGAAGVASNRQSRQIARQPLWKVYAGIALRHAVESAEAIHPCRARDRRACNANSQGECLPSVTRASSFSGGNFFCSVSPPYFAVDPLPRSQEKASHFGCGKSSLRPKPHIISNYLPIAGAIHLRRQCRMRARHF